MKITVEFSPEEMFVVKLALRVIARKTRYQKTSTPTVARALHERLELNNQGTKEQSRQD